MMEHAPDDPGTLHLAVMRYGMPYPACQPHEVKRYWRMYGEPADVNCPDCLALLAAGFVPPKTGVLT